MRRISYLGWVVLLSAFILTGCGKLERKGTRYDNIPPLVFFTNVPPESTYFSTSPQIYWYGTDKDGFITAYQYAVIKDSVKESWGGLDAARDSLKTGPDSASWINNLARLNVFGEHVPALKGHQRNVRLYAEMDPDIFTPQYIFLRAVDNAGGISEMKTHMYWRNNHPPQCSIAVDTIFLKSTFYCLPETTKTWKGIEIGWIGSDTLDYPDERDQPDFYFRWELWGPYKDKDSLYDPNASMVASSLDSIEIGGEWFYDEWTLNKSHLFKNLENYPGEIYGWYQLKVWSRDDAFVSSEAPATAFFRILKPVFRYQESALKTILVVDATDYSGKADGRPPTSVTHGFYEEALSQAGICDYFNIYTLSKKVPIEDTLSRYDLVIVLNLGSKNGIIDVDPDYVKYMNYLNVGGRLWIIGMTNYESGGSGKFYLAGDPEDPRDEGIRITNPNTYKFVTEYLGVEGVFNPGYAPGFPLTLEFIGAEPFGSWDFPSLQMDADKAAQLEGYDSTTTGLNFPENGIPRARNLILSDYDFDKRSPRDRRVYSFVSRLGLDSEMYQMPCATTYIGSTYRTAEFAFPLSLMKDSGALEAFGKMVGWFWEDLPQP